MDERATTNGNDWFTSQQKYWDAWLSNARQHMLDDTTKGGNASLEGAWPENLFKWWETISAAAPPVAQDFFGHLLQFGQGYFRMAEQIFGRGAPSETTFVSQWLESLRKAFESRTTEGVSHTDPDTRDAFDFLNLPLDTWRRTMSSMLPMPADFLQAVQKEDMVHAVSERINRFPGISTVGYSREAQEQYQLLMRLVLDYLRTFFEYNLAFTRIRTLSADRLSKKINEQASPINSLRKLYDLWVDASEEVYSEYVMSEEYARLYGRLVNELVAVKHQGSLLVDEVLDGMNMPTRREINSMQQHMHQMRRANHALRAEDRLDDQIGEQSASLGGEIGGRW